MNIGVKSSPPLVACIVGDTMSNGAYSFIKRLSNLLIINLPSKNSENTAENTMTLIPVVSSPKQHLAGLLRLNHEFLEQ